MKIKLITENKYLFFKASQRYVHFIMESAQYLYMDIHTMDGFFNWTMTYRKDSDFYRPYGRLVQVLTFCMQRI